MISFIIPAHNEESLIGATIAAIHAAAGATLAGREYEVVVADDASTDRTAEVAAEAGARVVRIEKRQIAAARNAGAAAATRGHSPREDVLIFVDADTLVVPGALREAMRAIERRHAGGGAPVRFDGFVPRWARVALPLLLMLFRVARLSGGAFLFARRDHFEAAGGWDETLFAGEEVAMATALKRRGRFAVLRTPVVTSGRKLRTHSGREIFAMCVRLIVGGRKSVRSRESLGLWYDPRRPDPQGALDRRATERAI